VPAGRPSKIHLRVQAIDPDTKVAKELPITEAICNMVALGVWPGNAAGSYGITPQTLWNWRQRGADALAAAAEHLDGDDPAIDYTAIPETERPYAEFFDALSRAERKGLAWHELNVRKAAASGREQGGRLSLEFLSRRLRSEYSRQVNVEHGGKVDFKIEQETDERIDELVAKLESSGEAPAAG